MKNIVCAEIQKKCLILYLRLDVNTIEYEEGFTRDMTHSGHFGTGDVPVVIRNRTDYEKAKALLDRAYNEN